MWPTELGILAVALTFGGFALLGLVLRRYYQSHKPAPELWQGETVIHSTAASWRIEGDAHDLTGWAFLTDLRLIWIPTLLVRLTQFNLVPTAYRHGGVPNDPIEIRLTHVINLRRLEDRRALSFEHEGRPVILFFFSDGGRDSRETWYEHLARAARRRESSSLS
jgi:hypothetical protein